MFILVSINAALFYICANTCTITLFPYPIVNMYRFCLWIIILLSANLVLKCPQEPWLEQNTEFHSDILCRWQDPKFFLPGSPLSPRKLDQKRRSQKSNLAPVVGDVVFLNGELNAAPEVIAQTKLMGIFHFPLMQISIIDNI